MIREQAEQAHRDAQKVRDEVRARKYAEDAVWVTKKLHEMFDFTEYVLVGDGVIELDGFHFRRKPTGNWREYLLQFRDRAWHSDRWLIFHASSGMGKALDHAKSEMMGEPPPVPANDLDPDERIADALENIESLLRNWRQ